MTPNRFGFPDLGLGIGLRGVHVPHILDERPDVGFFELLSENHLDAVGPAARRLERIVERYPVVLHGVSLSIGSVDPLDAVYLAKLRRLADRTGARWVSDHLSWSGVAGINTHDLLPLPYTEEALRHVALRARAVGEALGRPLVLENPSTYLTFAHSTIPEAEFLARLCDEADIGLLLDINNVYVSARNHGFDAAAYIDAIPADRVVQVHLAGHTDKGTHLLDTHSCPVKDDVWALYQRFVARAGDVSTLLEWDEKIPAFQVVHDELRKAERFRRSPGSNHAAAA